MADAATRKRLGIFCRHVGRAIDRFDMISGGDRILLGVSGGKDSLSMSLALKERLRRVVRSVISELSHHGKRVRQNIYRASWHVNWQYLPASLKTKPRSE